jgi:hypothetical protein
MMAPLVEDATGGIRGVIPVLQCGRAHLRISMNESGQEPASLPANRGTRHGHSSAFVAELNNPSCLRGVVAALLQSNEQQTGRSLRADDGPGS